MNNVPNKKNRLLAMEFLSAKSFVLHAVLILVLFAIAEACGLRRFTAIISGTVAAPDLGTPVCAVLGIGYMALYFGTVVLVPILLIAAALLRGARSFESFNAPKSLEGTKGS